MSIWSDLKRGKIKSSKIERILGPFPAMKHSFIYKVSRFPVRYGTLFYVIYDIKKEETYMTDTSKKIIPQKNFLTMFGQYRKVASDLTREHYLKPYKVVLTKRMREKGIFKRYFAHYFFDKESTIFEIIKQDFEVQSDFYQKVSLDWTLVGSKETVKMKNEQALEQAGDILTGMNYFLDPLEFYEEEISREEQVTGYLARLKFATESSTSIDKKSVRRKVRRKLERASKGKKKKSTSTEVLINSGGGSVTADISSESPPGGLGGAY